MVVKIDLLLFLGIGKSKEWVNFLFGENGESWMMNLILDMLNLG